MVKFAVITDSASDMLPGMAEKLGVSVVPLHFSFGTETYADDPDHRMVPPEAFFARQKSGEVSKTAGVNISSYTDAMRPYLEAGKDILVLALSSGLSSTYQSAMIAKASMEEEFPDRKICVVDTLCGSMGQTMLVEGAVTMRDAGATVEEVCAWAEEEKKHVGHLIMVDDLQHLKRGGRISSTVAFVGGVLGIRPTLDLDNEGKVRMTGKVRGRNATITALADAALAKASSLGQKIRVVHSICLEDARKLGAKLLANGVASEVSYSPIGPILGTYSGPGALALFLRVKER